MTAPNVKSMAGARHARTVDAVRRVSEASRAAANNSAGGAPATNAPGRAHKEVALVAAEKKQGSVMSAVRRTMLDRFGLPDDTPDRDLALAQRGYLKGVAEERKAGMVRASKLAAASKAKPAAKATGLAVRAGSPSSSPDPAPAPGLEDLQGEVIETAGYPGQAPVYRGQWLESRPAGAPAYSLLPANRPQGFPLLTDGPEAA